MGIGVFEDFKAHLRQVKRVFGGDFCCGEGSPSAAVRAPHHGSSGPHLGLAEQGIEIGYFRAGAGLIFSTAETPRVRDPEV